MVSLSWCRILSGTHDQILVFSGRLRVLSLRGVLSDERAGVSVAKSDGQLYMFKTFTILHVFIISGNSIFIMCICSIYKIYKASVNLQHFVPYLS
jgi:hypothetical protein